MKEHFHKIFSGFLIGLGIMISLTIWLFVEEHLRSNSDNKAVGIVKVDSSIIQINSSRISLLSEHVVVAINLKNTSAKHKISAQIIGYLSDRNGLFAECQTYATVLPDDTLDKVFTCKPRILPTSLPEETTLKVRVTNASYRETS